MILRSLSVQAFLLGAVGLLAACTDSVDEPAVDTVRPVKTEIISSPDEFLRTSFPGRAAPHREVNLAFEVSGRLTQLPVNVGDTVKEGALIASLNKDAYEARLEATLAQYKRAKSESRRLEKLLKAGSVSQTQFDDAQTQLDVLHSQRALNKKALADTSLHAPFSGRAVAVYLDNFTYVAASTLVARIIDISSLEMWIDVPAVFAKLQDKVEHYNSYMEFDVFPGKKFKARLKNIGIEASGQTRTFPVSFIIEQPNDLTILPGMSGRIYVEASRKLLGMSEFMDIPINAVFTLPDQTQSAVWLVKNNQIVHRPIELGMINGGRVSITTGLKPGDEIVVAGVHQLKAGQQVRQR